MTDSVTKDLKHQRLDRRAYHVGEARCTLSGAYEYIFSNPFGSGRPVPWAQEVTRQILAARENDEQLFEQH